MQVNIGINEQDRANIAQALSRVLADTYTLYLKTQGYHWNVIGPFFTTLHEAFGKQYDELAGAIDEVAERIRALGFVAPASFSEFVALASIQENKSNPTATEMVQALLSDHEAATRTVRAALEAAQKGGDEGTADLMVGRLQAHEKTAWMLRSLLA